MLYEVQQQPCCCRITLGSESMTSGAGVKALRPNKISGILIPLIIEHSLQCSESKYLIIFRTRIGDDRSYSYPKGSPDSLPGRLLKHQSSA